MSNATIRLPAVLGIGFTGHRNLRDESRCRQGILEFLRSQQEKMPGRVYGVSSAAAGGDLLFAESCLELGIPLHILLPTSREIFKKDFDEPSWARAEVVLCRAAAVDVTGDRDERREQFYDCGIVTVQQSQMLLALWDGQPSRGLGGTAEIVEFADKIGRPVIWLHSESGAIEVRNEAALAYGTADAELEFLNNLSDAGVQQAGDDPESLVRAWFAKVDANASHVAPVARRMASVPVIYTAAAALFSGFASRGHGAPAWLGVSMALGLFAAILPQALGLDRRQLRWARLRTAAEVCRSCLAMWNARGSYDVIGPEMLPDLSGLLSSLSFLRMLHGAGKSVTLEEFRHEYRERRLQDQIGYFSKNATRAEREGRVYRWIGWISGALALAVSAYLFAAATGAGSGHIRISARWMTLLISALFQVATVAGALVVIKDCDRRQQRYRELEQWLRNWVPQFESLHSWGSLLHVVVRVERALTVELLEWRSLVRHAKLPRK